MAASHAMRRFLAQPFASLAMGSSGRAAPPHLTAAASSIRGMHALARAAAGAAHAGPASPSQPSSSLPQLLLHHAPQQDACSTSSSSPVSTLFRSATTAAQALQQLPFSSSSHAWARALSTSSAPHQEPKPSESSRPDGKTKSEEFDSLEITPEKINNAITDKIPERPVGVVEGTSYSLIIAAAFAALIFVLYQFFQNFILEPTGLQCFNHTLETLKADPRITVRLGSADDIKAWGSNSQSRVGRQQIPHQIYKDYHGTEHVRIQFYMRGPSGTGLVNADMFRDPTTKNWQYTYLIVDTYTSSSQTPSRVHIVRPGV